MANKKVEKNSTHSMVGAKLLAMKRFVFLQRNQMLKKPKMMI